MTDETSAYEKASKRPAGMFGFTLVWIGQVVSMLGSAMTGFALMIWAWDLTGQATALALVAFFNFVPLILMMPIAGALVDRWDRKTAMILSDLAAGLGTVALLIIYTFGTMEIWHLYVVGVFVGIFSAFQFPAYSAAVSTMVDKKHYQRASGMLGIAGSVAGIFGPPMAVALLVFIGISGVFIIDVITFCFAISMLLIVHIPRPPIADDIGKGIKGVFKDAAYGFKYIYRRKPLLGLQLTFFVFNLVMAFGMTIFAPMILARTGSDKVVLGAVESMMAVGGVIGGIALAVWGGPKRRIYGLLGGMFAISIILAFGLGVGQHPIVWMVAGFLGMLLVPTLNGSSQAIWQSKISANRQGRVFAARGFIAQAASALSMVAVGPLADLYFEPAMNTGGSLTGAFGWLVGTGPGAGMAVMVFLSGTVASIVAVVAYGIRPIRNAETIIPDAVDEDGGGNPAAGDGGKEAGL